MASKDTYKVDSAKTQMDCIYADSIIGIIDRVNSHNTTYSDSPIMKEDIVQLVSTDGAHFLLYYK